MNKSELIAKRARIMIGQNRGAANVQPHTLPSTWIKGAVNARQQTPPQAHSIITGLEREIIGNSVKRLDASVVRGMLTPEVDKPTLAKLTLADLYYAGAEGLGAGIYSVVNDNTITPSRLSDYFCFAQGERVFDLSLGSVKLDPLYIGLFCYINDIETPQTEPHGLLRAALKAHLRPQGSLNDFVKAQNVYSLLPSKGLENVHLLEYLRQQEASSTHLDSSPFIDKAIAINPGLDYQHIVQQAERQLKIEKESGRDALIKLVEEYAR
jgi:hypothetical protein